LGGRIMVYDGVTGAVIRDFTVFDRSFLGGVRVAAGDVDGDGYADIIAGSGFGATPHIKVFSGQTNALIRSFLAYDAAFQRRVFVAVANLNNDRFAEIVTSAGTNGHVKAFEGSTLALMSSFIPGDRATTGVTSGPIVAVDRNGDGISEILVTLSGPP